MWALTKPIRPAPACCACRYELLSEMPPWMGGGEMIQEVLLEGSTYAETPSRFEAGTPAIAEAIGWGAACDYLSGLGMERVAQHERELGGYLYDRVGGQVGVVGWLRVSQQNGIVVLTTRLVGLWPNCLSACLAPPDRIMASCLQLRSIDRVRIYGPPPEAAQGRAALATFNVEGIHPTDISTILDSVSAPEPDHLLPMCCG